MRTLRCTLPLLVVSVGNLGCSSLATVRPGTPPKVTTVSSVGDEPKPVISGLPGQSAVADVDARDRPSQSRDRVSGRVVDARGKPVPGAQVRLAISGAAAGRATTVDTDAAGRFTLHGLRPDTDYTVLAEIEDTRGKIFAGRTSAQALDPDVEITLTRATAGRVSSVSERREADEDTASPNSDAGTNPEDLPPAQEAEDVEFSERALNRVATGTDSTQSATSSWRGGGNTGRRAPKRDGDPVGELSGPTGSGDFNDNDGPNPLPPALERESEPVTGTRGANRAGPRSSDDNFTALAETQPAPAAGQSPIPPNVKESAQDSSPVGTTTAPVESKPTESSAPPALPESRPADTPVPAREPQPEPAPSLAPESKPVESPKAASEAAPSSSPADTPAPSSSPADTPAPTEPAPNTQAATSKRRPTWGDLDKAAQPAVATAPNTATASNERPRLVAQRRPRAVAGAPKPGSIATCQFDAKSARLVDFQLPDLQGQPVHFKDLDADFILVDFWGSWCRPCVASIPHLIELQKRASPRRLAIVGVAYENEPLADAALTAGATAKKLGVNYPILLGGTDGQPCPLQAALHVQAFPTMVLLDRHGRILWREQGASTASLARLDRVIASAVNGDVVRR
jgi:thiol-disulfide isomerase/thioredoxin